MCELKWIKPLNLKNREDIESYRHEKKIKREEHNQEDKQEASWKEKSQLHHFNLNVKTRRAERCRTIVSKFESLYIKLYMCLFIY